MDLFAASDSVFLFPRRSILCFPIKDEKEVLGVAELCNKLTGPHFTDFDEEAARAFAIYCGIALVNSFMYRKVMDTQERVQLSNELMMYHMQVGPAGRRREMGLTC